jgi:hypothetical protein
MDASEAMEIRKATRGPGDLDIEYGGGVMDEIGGGGSGGGR